MAYTFDKINNALGNQEDQKSNIFDQNSASNQQAGQQGTQQGGQGQVKTSDTGDVSTGDNTNAASQTQQGGQQASATMPGRSAMTAIQKAQGQVPGAFTQAQDTLSKANQSLQDEANNYVQGYKNKDYGVSNDTINQALGGNQNAFGQLQQRLSQQGPTDLQQFKYSGPTSFSDIDALKNDAGIQNMLRQQAGGQYSGGESAFDLAVLKRNPQFNLIRQQLLSGENQLQQQAGQLGQTATQQATDAATANYNKATQGIQSNLGGQADELMKAAQAKADQENQARAAFLQNNPQFLQQQAQSTMADIQKSAANDPMMLQALQQYGMPMKQVPTGQVDPDKGPIMQSVPDLDKYYKQAGQVQANQEFGAPEAQKFNAINQLLGKGGQTVQAGGDLGSQSGQFDANALKNDIMSKAAAVKPQLVQKVQTQIDAITHQAQLKLDSENKGRRDSGQPAVDAQRDKVNAGIIKQLQGKYGNVDVGSISDKVNLGDFVKGSNNASIGEYLSDKDIGKINDLYKQLGQQPPSFKSAAKTKSYDFDNKGYAAALENEVAKQSQAKSRGDAQSQQIAQKVRQADEQQAAFYPGKTMDEKIANMKAAQSQNRGHG